MKQVNDLNEKWIKASIIGTIWASSEIVIGSFLHNLKIPFTGSILTTIGVIILISISYIWKEKGIFWRAGLICAVMKTMSPSAVIFGPMIAIFSQAVVLEMSIRLLGRNLIAYILGAILAVSWNLFQKLANLIIFYGFDIIELYQNLILFAQKKINISLDIKWLPIIILLIIYSSFGFMSAVFGIKIGRKILKNRQNKEKKTFTNSLIWLFVNLTLLISALFLINFTNYYVWISSITMIVSIWVIRYKRALRQLKKPKFWISFVLISMLTAFIFTNIQTDKSIFDAFIIGLKMNFRAVVVIIGFSALGTELYNPKIRSFFLKTSFKKLALALELSFETLPSVIANTPDFKTIIKNPISVLSQVILQAEVKFKNFKKKADFEQKIFIVTGKTNQGKTTIIKQIINDLQEKKINVSGFYSLKIIENKINIGYDIFDISNQEKTVFLRHKFHENNQKIGRFYIYPEGLNKGQLILEKANFNDIVVIDEIGKLELNNKAWSSQISSLIINNENHILMSIRDIFVQKVIEKWSFKNYFIYDISEYNHTKISHSILNNFNSNN